MSLSSNVCVYASIRSICVMAFEMGTAECRVPTRKAVIYIKALIRNDAAAHAHMKVY